MNFSIKKYTGNTKTPTENEIVFYIQSVGKNSGRPLKNAIPNCWEFRTMRSIDFEILYIIFISKILNNFHRGSVITFIALYDYKKIITPILQNSIHENGAINERYLQIRKIEKNISNYKLIQEKSNELKILYAKKTMQIISNF